MNTKMTLFTTSSEIQPATMPTSHFLREERRVKSEESASWDGSEEGRDISNLTEMAYLGRLFHLFEFKDVPVEQIKTTGYVIDSIETAVWCLLTTDSYKDCMLKAINLGDDTDTVAAIAGGLAGLYYGFEEIPKDWLAVIKKREWIEGMCEGLE